MTLRTICSLTTPIAFALAPVAAAAPPVGAQADQLAAILDYVVSDYQTAVGDHGVLDAGELKEQQGFLREALSLAGDLPAAQREALSAPLQAALTASLGAQAPGEVVPRAKRALEDLARWHPIQRSPREPPSYERGRALYQAGCVACHAQDGSGHTDLKLSTRPPDMRDPSQAGPLSPYRVFNAVTYGVPGTAMPSFQDAWGPAERWDIAFYLMALGHPVPPPPGQGPPARRLEWPPAASLGHLASTTDDQLRAELRASGLAPERVDEALAAWRQTAPYASPGPAALATCRHTVARAVREYRTGERAAARGSAIAAYLDEFEAHEAGLRVRDSSLVTELEGAFADLRGGIEAGVSEGQVESLGARVEALLERAEELQSRGGGGVSFAAALAIALREGLEAALLLGALLALAVQSGKRGARQAVHAGWIAALVAGGATWWLSGAIVSGGGARRETIEGAVEILTAALLLGASHWLLAQASAKRWMGFLSRHARAAGASAAGLAGLAFLAIYREAFEVVVFYRGLLLESPGRGRAVLAGALAGGAALVLVVLVFQKLGRRLKPRPLLVSCGALLCGLAVVMVGEGVRALQEAGLVGLHAMELPQLPSLGFFATAEGVAAQGLVLLALLASFAFTFRGKPLSPSGRAG